LNLTSPVGEKATPDDLSRPYEGSQLSRVTHPADLHHLSGDCKLESCECANGRPVQATPAVCERVAVLRGGGGVSVTELQ